MKLLTGTLRPYLPQLAALSGLWAYFVLSSPTFRGQAAIFPVLEGFILLGIVTAGISVTLIAGELDLSVGSTAAVAGIVAVECARLGLVPAVAIATVIGVLFGLAQGAVIAKLAINSLVFTIGTLILVRGIAFLITKDPVPLADIAVSDPLFHRWGVFTPASLTAFALLAVVAAFLWLTAWGREIYATGGGRQEAAAAGVSTTRALVIAFACSAGAASLAGALVSIQGGSAAPQAFSELALSAVVAALIGGVSLYGGSGTVFNVILGVAIVSLIGAGLADRGAQAYVNPLVTGGLLIGVISFDYVVRRIRESHRLKLARKQFRTVEVAREPA